MKSIVLYVNIDFKLVTPFNVFMCFFCARYKNNPTQALKFFNLARKDAEWFVYYFLERFLQGYIHSLLYVQVPRLCCALFTRISPRRGFYMSAIHKYVYMHASY